MMFVTSLGGNLSEMNSIAWVEGCHHGNNGHVSVTKSSLHIGGLEDISYGLIWRHMGSSSFTYATYTMNE